MEILAAQRGEAEKPTGWETTLQQAFQVRLKEAEDAHKDHEKQAQRAHEERMEAYRKAAEKRAEQEKELQQAHDLRVAEAKRVMGEEITRKRKVLTEELEAEEQRVGEQRRLLVKQKDRIALQLKTLEEDGNSREDEIKAQLAELEKEEE